MSPFRPGGPVRILQFGGTLSADLGDDYGSWIRIANLTGWTAFIATGADSDLTAGYSDSPVPYADFPIPPGAVAVSGIPDGHRYVAAYLSPIGPGTTTSDGRVFISRGSMS